MSTRQFEHLQRATLERLRTHIPDGCPLHVERVPGVQRAIGLGFQVRDGAAGSVLVIGRAQVVQSFIDGFAAGWRERSDGGTS